MCISLEADLCDSMLSGDAVMIVTCGCSKYVWGQCRLLIQVLAGRLLIHFTIWCWPPTAAQTVADDLAALALPFTDAYEAARGCQ